MRAHSFEGVASTHHSLSGRPTLALPGRMPVNAATRRDTRHQSLAD